MPAVERLNAEEATPTLIEEILDHDGCLVIENLLPKSDLHALKSELEGAFEAMPLCRGNFFGFATKRMSGVLAKSAIAQKMAVNPLALSVMDQFLLKSCRAYQLNLTQAIQIHPGEPAQIIHSDDLMFPFELQKTGDQKMINCMWAVDDFTARNGATHLTPGSHKWPRDRQPEPSEVCQGEMPAGSMLVYFGSLLHGGGGNRSSRPRTGLVLSYCLGWLRQAENHYLALPKDLVATFPQRLQRLVGYFVHEPNLGALEGRDPIESLSAGGYEEKRFEEFIPAEVQTLLEEYRRNAAA